MLTLTNWWWPYSVASILSALDLGYRVQIVVSDSAREGIEWLWDRQTEYPGRIQWTRDTYPRNSVASTTLTRFDYLPTILEDINEPVLVTDADVIHQRKLDIPNGADIALWRTPPWPMDHVVNYAKGNGFPLWWSELACITIAQAVFVTPNDPGKDFARRIKLYADSLREDGFGDRWGVDQVAIQVAERRLVGAKVFYLNLDGRQDVQANPAAAIWFPHPFQRDDPNSEWSQRAASYRAR